MGHDSRPSLGMVSRGTLPILWWALTCDPAPHPPQCQSPAVTSELFPTQWCRQLQHIAWSQNQRRKRLLVSLLCSKALIRQTQTLRAQKEKSGLSKIIQHDRRQIQGLLCTHKATSPSITREETQLTWNITRTRKTFKISPWSWKVCLYIQWSTQEVLYHPSKETTWAFWGQEEAVCQQLSQRWRGRIVSDNAGVFKLFLKQTKPLAVYFLGPGRGHTHTDRHLCCFPSGNSKSPLFKLTSMQGWKYKQTLFS